MRLIDADEAYKVLTDYYHHGTEIQHKALREALSKVPTVDPVKHGRWEVVDETEPRRYGCSVCKRLSWTEDNYCSYCGCKMDEVTDGSSDNCRRLNCNLNINGECRTIKQETVLKNGSKHRLNLEKCPFYKKKEKKDVRS